MIGVDRTNQGGAPTENSPAQKSGISNGPDAPLLRSARLNLSKQLITRLIPTIDIIRAMYTMAHRLLRSARDFGFPGVQSAMANPPFVLHFRKTALPQPVIGRLAVRAVA
jgi:hypothetical protein